MISSTLIIAFLSLTLATSLFVVRNERRQVRTLRRMLQISVRRDLSQEQNTHDHQTPVAQQTEFPEPKKTRVIRTTPRTPTNQSRFALF